MGRGVMECRPENAGRKVYCRQFSGSEADNATVRHGDALSGLCGYAVSYTHLTLPTN